MEVGDDFPDIDDVNMSLSLTFGEIWLLACSLRNLILDYPGEFVHQNERFELFAKLREALTSNGFNDPAEMNAGDGE